MKVSSLAFFLFANCASTAESRLGEAEEESYNTMWMQAVGTSSSTMINLRSDLLR